MNLKLITPEDFELLVFHLARVMGFDDVQLVSGPSDRGEDLIAYQPSGPAILARTRKWVFQCKHAAKISKREIEDELSNFVSRKIDTWLLVTTVRPSAEFRRWFNELEDNLKFGFHIQAWWRLDLETLLTTYASKLVPALPPSIVRHLNLIAEDRTNATDSLAVAQARLRIFADSQIERFARGKYIPKLYVSRRLQDDVIKFCAPESTIANLSKTSIVSVAEGSVHQLNAYLLAYDKETRDAEKDIEENDAKFLKAALRLEAVAAETRSLKRVGRKERKLVLQSKLKEITDTQQALTKRKQLMQEGLRKREENKALASNVIAGLSADLNQFLKAARALPSQDYFLAGRHYEIVSNALSSVLARIDAQVKELPKNEKGDLSVKDHFAWEPEIQMLAGEGFIQELRERLRSGMDTISRLFRNSLVIIDRAGSGKTNMTCHLVKSLVNDDAVVLLFGKEQFQGSEAIIKSITDVIAQALGQSSDPLLDMDRLLQKQGKFLLVFIDGINENRRIVDLDVALGNCLEWARDHRIKFVLTCRDIYWEFFNYEVWGTNVQRILREELNQFSRHEYLSALPLYLEHYRIECELADEAKEACHHPLLLRFFCEAYGSTDGPHVNLGKVRDIRLKELFDIYLSRKADQIRRALNHRNSDRVLRYLLNLVAFMFQHLTTVLKTSEVEGATGDPNTSTEDSLYLRLLDEDIIIEEQPGEDIYTRRITFVYEEFMEYLLARSIVNEPKRFKLANVGDIFPRLDQALADWVNARGVAEYVALMLMEEDGDRRRAISFLTQMVGQGKTWTGAFWSVIGKTPETQLDTAIFDLFSIALDKSSLAELKGMLTAMARYSQEGANKLASVLLWSVALPPALNWTELEALETMSERALQELGDRLSSRLKNQVFSTPPGSIGFDSLLRTLLPFINLQKRSQVQDGMRSYGEPADRYSSRAFVRVFWRVFPDYQPMLINGLFSDTGWTRTFCADRVKFTKRAARQIGYLCERLAEVEEDRDVKVLLKDCAQRLNPRGFC